MNLGIIPAAGKATRFGGILKELLPLEDGTTPLLRAVERLYTVSDTILVITSLEKIADHARAISAHVNGPVIYGLQSGADIWGAIKTATTTEDFADRYYMTMPDTLMPVDVFMDDPGSDLALGVFETDHPERFGTIQDGKVVDKPKDYTGPLPAFAWGTVTWSANVKDLWERYEIDSFPDALNLAIRKYGLRTHPINYYHDLASPQDYLDYLKGTANHD